MQRVRIILLLSVVVARVIEFSRLTCVSWTLAVPDPFIIVVYTRRVVSNMIRLCFVNRSQIDNSFCDISVMRLSYIYLYLRSENYSVKLRKWGAERNVVTDTNVISASWRVRLVSAISIMRCKCFCNSLGCGLDLSTLLSFVLFFEVCVSDSCFLKQDVFFFSNELKLNFPAMKYVCRSRDFDPSQWRW